MMKNVDVIWTIIGFHRAQIKLCQMFVFSNELEYFWIDTKWRKNFHVLKMFEISKFFEIFCQAIWIFSFLNN